MDFTTTTSWQISDNWSEPELVQTIVKNQSVELIYTQHTTIFIDWQGPSYRCFKIIFSCIDGKWNQSKPIYGEIIPATKQTYEFND